VRTHVLPMHSFVAAANRAVGLGLAPRRGSAEAVSAKL